MNTKCYECGKVMQKKVITHRYRESGLPDVYLEGVYEFSCKECGTNFVDIPEPVQLHIVLAIAISKSPEKLTGPEIRFLRKEVGMTGKAFAEFIGVDPVTLSRWENDKGDANKEASNDRLIRIAFRVMMYEKLKTMLSWLESQMERSKVITFRHSRLDIHAEAMKSFIIPSISSSNCTCR